MGIYNLRNKHIVGVKELLLSWEKCVPSDGLIISTQEGTVTESVAHFLLIPVGFFSPPSAVNRLI